MKKELNNVQKLQKKVIYILYAAALFSLIGEFVPAMKYVSGILVAIFFLCEMFLLSPVGILVMSLTVSIVLFLLPAVVGFFIKTLIESVFLIAVAVVLIYLLSFFILIFVNGTLVAVGLFTFTAPMTFALAFMAGTVLAGAATGYSAYKVLDKASENTRGKSKAVRNFFINLFLVILICWPILSYSGTINGALACKPAVILNQVHMNYMNIGCAQEYRDDFINEENWDFSSNFYQNDICSNNNNITQGDRNLIAGNDRMLAVVYNGLVYVQDAKLENNIVGTAYMPRKTDAMVINANKVYIFGYNKIFVCGELGDYTWKDTKYTSEFTKLSWEEQCEYVYDILERQNTKEDIKFSYDEVGVVAYAQRNGLLLNYNEETHTALFVKKDKKSTVTVFAQSDYGQFEQQVTFETTEANVPQTFVMAGEQGILYLNGSEVFFLQQKDNWTQYSSFTHPENKTKFESIHYGSVCEDNDVYSIYLDTDEHIFVDTRNVGKTEVKQFEWNVSDTKITGFAGEYIYSIQYDTNLISRLTYIQDLKDAKNNEETSETSGYRAHEIWMENWSYQRIKLDKSVLVE